MAQHSPVEVDKKALKEAEALWSNFINASKYGIAAIAVLLCVLGLAFI